MGDAKDEASVPRLAEGLKGLAVNLIVAILVWAFGTYVFLPLAPARAEIFGFPVDQVVSAIILVALLLAAVRILLSLREVSSAVGDMVVGRGKARGTYRVGVRALFYFLFAVVAYYLLFAFLAILYDPLRGIAVVLLALWAGLFLFQIGGEFSRRVEKATMAVAEAVERVVH